MKMSKLEKKFVNTRKHAQGNIRVIERLFKNLDLRNIKDVFDVSGWKSCDILTLLTPRIQDVVRPGGLPS